MLASYSVIKSQSLVAICSKHVERVGQAGVGVFDAQDLVGRGAGNAVVGAFGGYGSGTPTAAAVDRALENLLQDYPPGIRSPWSGSFAKHSHRS